MPDRRIPLYEDRPIPLEDPEDTDLRPLLLNVKQVAVLLSVSERTVRNLIKKRKLPVKFIGRRVLIPVAAVERYARNTAG